MFLYTFCMNSFICVYQALQNSLVYTVCNFCVCIVYIRILMYTRKFTRRASKRRCVLFAAVWREPGVIIRRVLFAAGWREPGVVCYHI